MHGQHETLWKALLASLVLLAVPGCGSKKDVVDRYAREAAGAEATRRSDDAEGFYRSAVERARELGAADQADALLQLGSFYRRQTGFAEAVTALEESARLDAGTGAPRPLPAARRGLDLARALAALDRWPEGAAALRSTTPFLGALPADEARAASELAAAYRRRLPRLGLDTAGLPE